MADDPVNLSLLLPGSSRGLLLSFRFHPLSEAWHGDGAAASYWTLLQGKGEHKGHGMAVYPARGRVVVNEAAPSLRRRRVARGAARRARGEKRGAARRGARRRGPRSTVIKLRGGIKGVSN